MHLRDELLYRTLQLGKLGQKLGLQSQALYEPVAKALGQFRHDMKGTASPPGAVLLLWSPVRL